MGNDVREVYSESGEAWNYFNRGPEGSRRIVAQAMHRFATMTSEQDTLSRQ